MLAIHATRGSSCFSITVLAEQNFAIFAIRSFIATPATLIAILISSTPTFARRSADYGCATAESGIVGYRETVQGWLQRWYSADLKHRNLPEKRSGGGASIGQNTVVGQTTQAI